MRTLFVFLSFSSLYLFVEGYMYNHPHQANEQLSPAELLNLALLQNKMEISHTDAFTQKRRAALPLRSFLSIILSIGRPEHGGTSSPRASPSPTWEGGRSMMRCGSGAGRDVSGL
jgi:hypothetical protein